MIKRASLVVWTLLMIAGPAWALQPPPTGEFVPIDQLPPSEQLPSAPLLVTAYAFVWVALLFYVWTIWRRLNKVESDMQALGRNRGTSAGR
jgi:CcmD family protein